MTDRRSGRKREITICPFTEDSDGNLHLYVKKDKGTGSKHLFRLDLGNETRIPDAISNLMAKYGASSITVFKTICKTVFMVKLEHGDKLNNRRGQVFIVPYMPTVSDIEHGDTMNEGIDGVLALARFHDRYVSHEKPLIEVAAVA